MTRKTKIIIAFLLLGLILILSLLIYFAVNKKTAYAVRLIAPAVCFLLCVLRLIYPYVGTGRFRKQLNEQIENIYHNEIGAAFRNDNKLKLRFMKGVTFFQYNKHNKAISILNNLLNKCYDDKDKFAVLFFIALSYKDTGNINKAETYLKDAILLEENRAALSNLGSIYLDKGIADKAIYYFKEAIKKDRDYFYAYNNLAKVYLDTAKYDLAIEYALKAKDIKNNLYQADTTLAIAYSALKNKDKAEFYYRQAITNGTPYASNIKYLMKEMYEQVINEDEEKLCD